MAAIHGGFSFRGSYFSLVDQSSVDPPSMSRAYETIDFNVYVDREARAFVADEVPTCDCKPQNSGVMCFDEDCINFAAMVECDPNVCHGGKALCHNHRIQKGATKAVYRSGVG